MSKMTPEEAIHKRLAADGLRLPDPNPPTVVQKISGDTLGEAALLKVLERCEFYEQEGTETVQMTFDVPTLRGLVELALKGRRGA